MQSAGVYWKTAYETLEVNDPNVFVVNAQHLKEGAQSKERGAGQLVAR